MKDLDNGEIPLISCGGVGHGLVGYFDIPPEHRYIGCLTIAYDGSWPLLAKFHPYEFGAKNDVAVLIPKEPMRNTTLLYMAAQLNLITWRYRYYHHCYRVGVRRRVN
jgi:type I restriction enzyme M protein